MSKTRSPIGPCSLSSNSPATSTPTGSPTFTSTIFYDRILEAKEKLKPWSGMERVCDWLEEKKSSEGESLPNVASRTKVVQEARKRRRIRMHPSTSMTPLTWRAAVPAASARRMALPPFPSPCCGRPGCTVPATQTDRHQVGAKYSICWQKVEYRFRIEWLGFLSGFKSEPTPRFDSEWTIFTPYAVLKAPFSFL